MFPMTWRSVPTPIALRRCFVASVLLCGTLCTPLIVFGQAPAAILPPDYRATDANFINLASAKTDVGMVHLSIGTGASTLRHYFFSAYGGSGSFVAAAGEAFAGSVYHNATPPGISAYCGGPGTSVQVAIGATVDYLCGTSTSYTSVKGQGSTLTTNSNGTLTYTQKDGTAIIYGPDGNGNYLPTQMTYPDGRIATITYKQVVVSASTGPYTCSRIQSVTRTDGLQLKYSYAQNTTPPNYGASAPWFQITSVVAINNTVDYCDPTADVCTYSVTWPSTLVSTDTATMLTFTDQGGQSTRYTFNAYGLKAIKPPSSSSADTITYIHCTEAGMPAGCLSALSVYQATRDGTSVWQYTQRSIPNGNNAFMLTGSGSPLNASASVLLDASNVPKPSPIIRVSTEDGTTYFMDNTTPADLVRTVQKPDGNSVGYFYDARGNVTSETYTAKPGSPLAPTSITANYDPTCTIPVKCNKPNWVLDARSHQSDFKYDPTHGGTLTVTLPADVNGIRPQTRYTYAQRFAWYKNASGSVVQAATPIWVLATESFCRTVNVAVSGVGCSPASDEVVTTYDYGPTSGANNLFLHGKAVTADGTTLRACYSYDIYGNKISETSPNAGLASCP
jgi:YD repeat-containing protein